MVDFVEGHIGGVAFGFGFCFVFSLRFDEMVSRRMVVRARVRIRDQDLTAVDVDLNFDAEGRLLMNWMLKLVNVEGGSVYI